MILTETIVRDLIRDLRDYAKHDLDAAKDCTNPGMAEWFKGRSDGFALAHDMVAGRFLVAGEEPMI